MTLRRCDSLPTRLRVMPIAPKSELNEQLSKQFPDSNTVPIFNNTTKIDEVIATWKSLHSDIEKIKNGLPSKNDPFNVTSRNREPATHTLISEFGFSKNDREGKLIFDKRSTAVCSSESGPSYHLPAHVAKTNNTVKCGANAARRRTLLERLLSWRTRDCNCREKFIPKLRPTPRLKPDDLLCTCEIARVKVTEKHNKFSERGRSKSVGYEATREVTQFRRCASAGATVGGETAATLRARAALTLARRYYPEGGWGWTVTVVGILVQIISHGLQLGGGTGAIACTAAVKYRVPPLYSYGEFLRFFITFIYM